MKQVLIEQTIWYELCARHVPEWASIYPAKLTDEQLIAAMSAKLDAMAARAEYKQRLKKQAESVIEPRTSP